MLFIVLITCTLIGVATLHFFVNIDKYATQYANNILNSYESHDTKLELEKLRIISFFPLTAEIQNFRATKGRIQSALWNIKVSNIKINSSFNKILNYERNVKFDLIEINKIEAVLIETNPKLDKKSKKKKSKKLSESKYSLQISDFKITNSKFEYIDKDPDLKREDGILVFDRINIKTNNIVLRKSDLVDEIKIVAQGFLENNEIKLKMQLDSFTKNFNLILKSDISSADLDSLNSYLIPVEKIKIYGHVEQLYTFSNMTQKKLSTNSGAIYSGLKIDVLKKDNRTAVERLLMDLIANLTLCNSNTSRGGLEKEEESHLEREDESVVQFLLRGILKSSMKIACM